jgi:hypothetical protein
MNCPINEQTADGVPVGRCWYYLKDGKTCPCHGDVEDEVRRFEQEGLLTLENSMRKRKGIPLLGKDNDR